MQKLPTISICTLTYNRPNRLKQLLRCIESQDYPLNKVEWLVLDDSDSYTESLTLLSQTKLRIKYQRIKEKLTLGKKRNLSHLLCDGEVIVYMDDDDFYFPSRISHAVETLEKSGRELAGSTVLPIYFEHDEQLWISGPFGMNHATANTFAMTREFARKNRYNNNSTCNEEKEFLNNYTKSMAQLDPWKTIICISHEHNTFDKRKMRIHGNQPRMRRSDRSKEADAHNLLCSFQFSKKSIKPSRREQSVPVITNITQKATSTASEPNEHQRKIPRVIYSTGSANQLQLPTIKQARERLIGENPDWEYKQISDDECLGIIRESFPREVLTAYQRINPIYGAAKADLFRYCALYLHGGVYLDIKSTSTVSLNKLIKSQDEFLLGQWDNRAGEKHYGWGLHNKLSHCSGGEYIQWFIASTPRNPLLECVIQRVTSNITNYPQGITHKSGKSGILEITGPIAYTLAINEYIVKNQLRNNVEFRYLEPIKDGLIYSIFENPEREISAGSTAAEPPSAGMTSHQRKTDEQLYMQTNALKFGCQPVIL